MREQSERIMRELTIQGYTVRIFADLELVKIYAPKDKADSIWNYLIEEDLIVDFVPESDRI